jgi:iron complex outermembrane recepter protein
MSTLKGHFYFALSALLFASIPATIRAQGAIAGTVTAARDSTPIHQATVFVIGTKFGAVTDAAGRFRIQALPVGEYTIIARRFGFTPDTSKLTVREGATARATLKLTEASISLSAVQVIGDRADNPEIPTLQATTLPATASVTAKKAEETTNIMDTEDAVKYMPTVFLRKRNFGDTQATLGTRVWGTNSSARSLIFADGVPLTALVANNNTVGGPRWGLVSPSEISRIDVMFGPFSAAYAGNSMGAVLSITTRLPEKFEGSVNQTQALQTFSLYGTKDTYNTSQTTLNVGDRFGKFSFWASGNYQKSNSQPLSYVTSASFPNNTTGAFPDSNKLNAPAHVLGASGLLSTGMTNAKLKLAYDLTPTVLASFTYGYWKNDARSGVDPYITSSQTGNPTFAGQSGFATGYYNLDQEHSAQILSLRSDTKGKWDFELIGTHYSFDNDRQRSPAAAAANTDTFSVAGRMAVLDGTGWATGDLKGTYRPGTGKHAISAGLHYDRYELANTTFNTSEWTSGPTTTVAAEGDGKTEAQAVWVQDAYQLNESFKITLGGRLEKWRGFDGYNKNGSVEVDQPTVEATKFSPKAVLNWTPNDDWAITTSVGKAYRFATASELYQLVTTGTTFTSPNPDLKPDDVLAAEVRVERLFTNGRVQVSLFQDDVHDAIISQFLPLVPGSTTLFSFPSNVDHIRARGVELLWGSNNVLIDGLELSGNVTYLKSEILALSGRASATADSAAAIGKRLPNIPDWRATAAATYRPNTKLAFTLSGRYSDRVYTTLDNADVRPNTYQGFASWFVMDSHVNYRFNEHWTVGGGVDNMLNGKYFLFHPFPQRSFVANVKYGF